MERIINIREFPEWLDRAADYFTAKWNIDRQLYIESMTDSLTTAQPVPRWFLMLREEDIIGCFGLIENDFMVDTELCPWLCGLYVEPQERGRQLGSRLLGRGLLEAAALGFDKVYLNTDHVGYYKNMAGGIKGLFRIRKVWTLGFTRLTRRELRRHGWFCDRLLNLTRLRRAITVSSRSWRISCPIWFCHQRRKLSSGFAG